MTGALNTSIDYSRLHTDGNANYAFAYLQRVLVDSFALNDQDIRGVAAQMNQNTVQTKEAMDLSVELAAVQSQGFDSFGRWAQDQSHFQLADGSEINFLFGAYGVVRMTGADGLHSLWLEQGGASVGGGISGNLLAAEFQEVGGFAVALGAEVVGNVAIQLDAMTTIVIERQGTTVLKYTLIQGDQAVQMSNTSGTLSHPDVATFLQNTRVRQMLYADVSTGRVYTDSNRTAPLSLSANIVGTVLGAGSASIQIPAVDVSGRDEIYGKLQDFLQSHGMTVPDDFDDALQSLDDISTVLTTQSQTWFNKLQRLQDRNTELSELLTNLESRRHSNTNAPINSVR